MLAEVIATGTGSGIAHYIQTFFAIFRELLPMPLFGSHLSIAGGMQKAVYAAAEYGMDCVQIFTKNNNQWRAKPLTEDMVETFLSALEDTGIQKPCSHASYLINLATPKNDLWEKSIEAMIVELERADRLSLEGVVMHPGSHTGSGEEAGLVRISQAIDIIHKRLPDLETQIWLENTAGQGTNLGYRFEHLQSIIEQVEHPHRLGVCLDSCHLFAAGYPLSLKNEYTATMNEFDEIVGKKYLQAFHLNDSKREFESRVDRHEHLGEGYLGLEAFRWIVRDPFMKDIPMYLETPKGTNDDGEDWDAINLAKLQELLS